MGVEVRVSAPGCLVLVGDGHQPWQTLEVFVSGDRVVHSGVAGVVVQVLHRRVHRAVVCGGEDFRGDVVGERADQRDALALSVELLVLALRWAVMRGTGHPGSNGTSGLRPLELAASVRGTRQCPAGTPVHIDKSP